MWDIEYYNNLHKKIGYQLHGKGIKQTTGKYKELYS